MRFSDQVKKYAGETKSNIVGKRSEAIENAERRLSEVLGAEAALVKDISFDIDSGKFCSVDAPASVLDRMRAADLLKD